ncbi:MAG: PhzF family phenazine biosynthesis protein [Actinomycetota bacterium]
MRLIQVDAFTGMPFAGNPAAVCLMDGERDATWMQDVAAEMNLSETAFVTKQGGGFGLRWFTPAVEVDLCGHATLASAHALWEEGEVREDEIITFHTRSGPLTCHRRTDRIEMDFPSRTVTEVEPPAGMVEALGVDPVSVWHSEVGYLVELAAEENVREARPDFARLGAIPDAWVCITSIATTGGFDFVSRFFAPQSGIDEDPVTGAAHCALADFWSVRSGRNEFRAYQCSKRGGVVHVSIDGDRVRLGGQAVTVLRAELV